MKPSSARLGKEMAEVPGIDAVFPEGPSGTKYFAEPWQAQVFALTVTLNENGVFTWPEWAKVFSAHLDSPDAAADASDYFHHWTAALVEILEARDVVTAQAVEAVANAWQRAAHNTPHGQPIELSNAGDHQGSRSAQP